MKKSILSILSAILALCCITFSSCTDDEENIGSSITKGEVSIVVDSTFTVSGKTVRAANIDSRSGGLLIGRLSAEDFGELNASFVGQLMPAASLSIPDSIALESVSGMTMRFTFTADGLTGDTLAPQQLSVYALTKKLPSGLDNTFDPEGYYNPAVPLGSASYTATELKYNSDNQAMTGYVNVPLTAEYARQVVAQYRSNPAIFQWPETFAKYFPGIYVKSTFGRGLVLNFTNTEFLTMWTRKVKVTKVIDNVSVTVDSLLTDTTSLFTISPEVLSANLLKLTSAPSVEQRIAQGEYIIQSPAGYNVEIDFPAQAILDRYNEDDFNLGVVNTLTYTLPVAVPQNTYNISAPPYLLMIKTSKLKEFFSQNKVPETDDTDAFWATYDKQTGEYVFNNMRPYIINLMKSGKPVSEEDTKFTLVPVSMTTETTGYGTAQKTIVTECLPYIAHPTICIANLAGSKVKFTYSRQVIR